MLRVIGWNIVLLGVGLALVAGATEVYLSVTTPFPSRGASFSFVPNVGRMYSPNTEIRHTDYAEFWTVTRTNSLGFADREPIGPARAAAGCNLAVIGDSTVAAVEVPIVEKFHVRLETLAARELPHLDVTTSAFGRRGWAPVNELALYDEYARRLRPRVVVLVMTVNDLWGSSSLMRGLETGLDPDRLPFVSARKNADGTLILRPPDPDAPLHARLPFSGPRRWGMHALRLLGQFPNWYLPSWLAHHIGRNFPHANRIGMAMALRKRPQYAESVDALLGLPRDWHSVVRADKLPRVFEEALAHAAFALDQFQERAERDGFSLVVLATEGFGGRGHRTFDRLYPMVAERKLPIVGMYDYILREGGNPQDARWAYDSHWNAGGHQWAAEALLEHLQQYPELCAPRSAPPRRSKRAS